MKVEGFHFAPVYVFVVLTHIDIVVYAVLLHLCYHMRAEIHSHDPAAVIFDIIIPLLIVEIVRAMKVEHILTYQYEAADTLRHHRIYQATLQLHDVIVHRIIPLAHQFYYSKSFFIIDKKDFAVERRGAKEIPLRMYQVVIDTMRIVKLTVPPAVKWRQLVISRNVVIPPLKKRLYLMHTFSINRPPPL